MNSVKQREGVFNSSEMCDQSQFARARCKIHPDLDIDTICFHQNCRERYDQVMCACCGETAEPHQSHPQQQYPIHKSSPGFRLVNFSTQPVNLVEVTEQQEDAKNIISDCQRMFSESIEKMMVNSQKKIECFSDFLNRNGVFKVCSKLKHESDAHSKCCIHLINTLKDLEERGAPTPLQVSQMIQSEIKKERLLRKSQLKYLKTELLTLFRKIQEISHTSLESFIDDIEVNTCNEILHSPRSSLDLNKNFTKTSIFLNTKQQTENKASRQLKNKPKLSHHKFKDQIMRNEKASIEKALYSNAKNIQNNMKSICIEEQTNLYHESSIIYQLTTHLDSEQVQPLSENVEIEQKKKTSKKVFQNILSNNQAISAPSKMRFPYGCQKIAKDTLLVWDGVTRSHIMFFLSNMIEIKHLIIEDKTFAIKANFKEIAARMPWLIGLHLHCETEIVPSLLAISKLNYLSFFPNYQFIQAIDISKFFSRAQRTMIDHLPLPFNQKMQKKPNLQNIYICSPSGNRLNKSIKEVNYVQDESDHYWNVEMQNQLLIPDKLLILVFSNVSIQNYDKFPTIFAKQTCLHTIVFDDCLCQYNSIVQQFRHLEPDQLRHLQISGDNLTNKIQLEQSSFQEIFKFYCLQTLILTNVECIGLQKIGYPSKIFRGIKKLKQLIHLNLFNSEPVFNDFLSYLHSTCLPNLKTLNLGCSQIKDNSIIYLLKMTNLQALNVDYTSLKEQYLQKIVKQMDQLQRLSIENMNGKPIKYIRKDLNPWKRKKYGFITPSFFEKLRNKTLKYVNIFGCEALSSYEWDGYDQLECIRANTGLLSAETISKLQQRGIKIFLQESTQVWGKSQSKTQSDSSCFDIRSLHLASKQNEPTDKKSVEMHVNIQEISDYSDHQCSEEPLRKDSVVVVSDSSAQPNGSRMVKTEFSEFPFCITTHTLPCPSPTTPANSQRLIDLLSKLEPV